MVDDTLLGRNGFGWVDIVVSLLSILESRGLAEVSMMVVGVVL